MGVYDEPGQRALAPMVRINTLPMRLLALEYGADLVYSEELVAKGLAASVRVENTELGTTDWQAIDGKGEEKVVLRIAAAKESERLVLQLGASDGVCALAAARHVADRVAAVDLNMGCPMAFSTSSGMGAALLRTPDLACDILKTLRRNLSVPITCKIRLLPSAAETVELARRLEACGVAAVAVHCREVHHRSYEPALWSELLPVVDALSVPVVANGDCFRFDDFAAVREATGCHSVMTARAALWNPSIFRSTGLADLEAKVVPRYERLCTEWGNDPLNTKSVVTDMRAAGTKGRIRGPKFGMDAWRQPQKHQTPQEQTPQRSRAGQCGRPHALRVQRRDGSADNSMGMALCWPTLKGRRCTCGSGGGRGGDGGRQRRLVHLLGVCAVHVEHCLGQRSEGCSDSDVSHGRHPAEAELSEQLLGWWGDDWMQILEPEPEPEGT